MDTARPDSPIFSETRIKKAAFFLFGVSILFNGYAAGLRFTDLSAVALIMVCLTTILLTPALFLRAVLAIGLFCLLLAVSSGLFSPSGLDTIWYGRVLVSFIAGLIFYTASPALQLLTIRGIVAGGIAGFGVALAQYAGVGDVLISLGLQSPVAAQRGLGSWDDYHSTLRIVGMWGDPNEFGPMSSMSMAAALVAMTLESTRRTRLFVVITALMVAANAAMLSFNRSSVIASGAVLVRYYATRGLWRFIKFAVVASAIAAVAFFFFREAMPDHYETLMRRLNGSASNADGRSASLFAAIRLATLFPFGISSQLWPEYMRSLSGVANPHNAFLGTAFAGGILLAVFTALCIAYSALRAKPFEQIMATQIGILFMFEALNYSPSAVAILGILWARPILDLLSRPNRAAYTATQAQPIGQRTSLG